MKLSKSFMVLIKWVSLSLVISISLLGCVSITPKTVESMPDWELCNYLGPDWITTQNERKTIVEELEQRGVQCVYSQITRGRDKPKSSSEV